MNKKGYFYLGLSIFAFSTIEIVSKSIVNDFHPLQMNFLRFFIGSLCLLPFTVKHIMNSKVKLSIKDMIILTLLGILAVPVSMTLFQISILYTKASILAVLISSNAIFVAPFSYFILKEKIDKSILVSLVLGIAGMAIIANPSSSMGSKDLIGILFGIAASVTFALFTVLGKRTSSRLGGLLMNNFVFLSGSMLMLPYMLYSRIPIFSGINSSNILQLLYLGLVVTVGGYIFLFKGIALLPANKGSLVFFVKPVLAGILAYITLDETITPSLALGTVCILAGMLFVITRKSTVNKKKAAA